MPPAGNTAAVDSTDAFGGASIAHPAANMIASADRRTIRTALAALREKPFALFFALGVLFGWLGVSHWIFYAAGLSESYSGTAHAALQLQCFELAFAAGFLFTAIPRRTSSPHPSLATLAFTAASLSFTAIASLAGSPQLASWGYLATLLSILVFAVRRLSSRQGLAARRPPATFVLVPIAFFYGITGALLTSGLFETPLAATMLGFDLIRQGVFFCLLTGIGSLIMPLLLGYTPPPDLTAATKWKILRPAALGLAIGATFILEHMFALRWAMSIRGLLVLGGLLIFGGIHRRARAPGIQRRIARIAAWCVPAGAIFAGIFPDYRIALLHITFVAGFGLLTFAIASHVVLSHTDREEERDTARFPVLAYAFLMLLAAATRLTADVLVDSYFRHLAYASAVWIVGSLVWLALVSGVHMPSSSHTKPPS